MNILGAYFPQSFINNFFDTDKEINMKTEKLYYADAYIKEFDATVLSCTECEGGYDIVLDKTAFFPEEGGQYSDRGYIENAYVFDVREKEKIIHHFSKNAIDVNKSVHCKLDFEERFDKMQQHTAEHIISGILHSLYGIENTGFHLGAELVTLDTSRPVSADELSLVEKLVNEAIQKNVKITASFPSDDELSKMEYRSKLELTEDVRIVRIEGYDVCACCAPHVGYTGEIGQLVFVESVKHKGGSRITMLAGMRAYSYLRKILSEASAVSVKLSAPKTNIAREVDALLDAKAALEYKINGLGNALAGLYAASIPRTGGHYVFYSEILDFDALKALMNTSRENVGGIFVGLVGEENSFRYILMTDSADFQSIVKNANEALSGRGGGRAPMASGTFLATLDKIKEYFSV